MPRANAFRLYKYMYIARRRHGGGERKKVRACVIMLSEVCEIADGFWDEIIDLVWRGELRNSLSGIVF